MTRKSLRVDVKDVFTYERVGNKVTGLSLGGESITENQMENLKGEVSFFEKTHLWKIFNETMRQAAIDKMVYKSTNFDDMRNGKEMLEILKLMGQVMYLIDSYKKKPPSNTGKPIGQ